MPPAVVTQEWSVGQCGTPKLAKFWVFVRCTWFRLPGSGQVSKLYRCPLPDPNTARFSFPLGFCLWLTVTLGSGLRSPRLTHTLQIQLVFVAQASDDDDDKEDDGINNGNKK